jgi:hypothetical protein
MTAIAHLPAGAAVNFAEEMIVEGRHPENLLCQVVITEPGGAEPEIPKKGTALTNIHGACNRNTLA